MKRLLFVTALVAVPLKASFLIGPNAPATTVEQGQAQSGQTLDASYTPAPADTSSQSGVIIQALTCRLTNVGLKFEGLAENKTGAPQPAMELNVIFKSVDGQLVSFGMTYANYNPGQPILGLCRKEPGYQLRRGFGDHRFRRIIADIGRA